MTAFRCGSHLFKISDRETWLRKIVCIPIISAGSPERRLIEAPELARMELGQLAAEQLDGSEADHQMLADGAVIEGIGGTRQFDLAVKRLVGNAQQRAIGDAQPIALRGDGA